MRFKCEPCFLFLQVELVLEHRIDHFKQDCVIDFPHLNFFTSNKWVSFVKVAFELLLSSLSVSFLWDNVEVFLANLNVSFKSFVTVANV